MDLATLEANLSARGSPGMMLTAPSTLGLFEPNIFKISEMVHNAGGLMYGDGANLNALVGHIRPGDLGFDVMHINLHKTFTTPARWRWPRQRPCGMQVHARSVPAWPCRSTGKVISIPFVQPETVIGRVKNFWGNFGMHVRAYTYIRHLGLRGSEAGKRRRDPQRQLHPSQPSGHLLPALSTAFACTRLCCRARTSRPRQACTTLDIAKRLID